MKKTLVIFLLSLVLVQADLEVFSRSFNTNDFNDLDGWAAVNSYRGANVFNVCSGIRIVGGHSVFAVKSSMVKNFKLPPHFEARIKLQLWKIDSWDNEHFYVYADDKLVFDKSYAHNQGEQLCGAGHDWKEVRENIDVKIAHTNPTLNIILTSTLDQGAADESWAIRDFELFINRCPEECDTCKNANANECAIWSLYKWSWTELKNLGAEGWKVEGGPNASSECSGISMFGGFNNFGKGAKVSKTFKMPPHYRVKVKMTFAKIDSWDNEEGYLTIDGQKIWSRRFQYNEGYKNSICGAVHNTWLEVFVGVNAEGNHTGKELDVVISSTLNQAAADESWGVRDFFLYYAKCAPHCVECTGPTNNDCSKCGDNFAIQDGKCTALTNFILLEQSFQAKKFTDLNGWQLTGNVGGKTVSNCDGFSLVGGFGIMGVKAVAKKSWNLPSHKRIRLQVQLWKIDSWDNEFFYIQVDDNKIFNRQIGFASGGRPRCGQGHANWNELVIDVDEIVHHDSENLTVLISSTVNQHANDESWGFREFKIFYEFKEPCAIFYTECDYKGAAYEFCGESPDFRKDNVPPIIRSIKLPPQGRLTIWDKESYEGKKITYTKSQPCIEGFEWSFLQRSSKVESTEWKELRAEE